ncbi:MAG TPA: UDP-N-acetylmuramate dehydrogenase [Methylocella sp.]|jgi:UDP-N-acetylmuramate dehydrogenase|nr:UDP-N-acetylmuramate dehydrogenase [Methylocella sp.]
MPLSPHKESPAILPGIAPKLTAQMPELRGSLAGNAPMAPLSWFRTGGPAQVLFEPADENDLAYFLARLDSAIPVLVLGAGSNILVRDGGIEGVVIRLGKSFQEVAIEGLFLRAGAGAPDVKLSSAAAKAGLAGLSFFRGIPGSVGGALRMNAGAYGAETRDVLVSCSGIGRKGNIVALSNSDMGFSYRHCGVAEDVIFTQAVFAGSRGDPHVILSEMAEITKARAETQPVNTRTGGSTFKNPPGHKAWELIDKAGCRGLVVGDAQVSKLHCNFLINRGKATAADLETLGELIRARVLEASGVALEWEILRVGVP